MKHAQFAELRELLIVQDIAFVLIALVLVVGMIAVIMAAGSHTPSERRK